MTRSKTFAGRKAPLRRRAATTASTRRSEEGKHIPQARSALAIQLAVDPAVGSFRYVASLPVFDRNVPIRMLVADTNYGRVAFDIVDGRAERDLDEDGLLLVALQQHDIRLIETDRATIESEPRASNCRKIWRHRDRHVEASLADAVDEALAVRSAPTIRALGEMVGLRHPIATVCALICRKRLQVEFNKPFDLDSVVRRPDYTGPSPLFNSSNSKMGARTR